jgi:hypothetical protein
MAVSAAASAPPVQDSAVASVSPRARMRSPRLSESARTGTPTPQAHPECTNGLAHAR